MSEVRCETSGSFIQHQEFRVFIENIKNLPTYSEYGFELPLIDQDFDTSLIGGNSKKYIPVPSQNKPNATRNPYCQEVTEAVTTGWKYLIDNRFPKPHTFRLETEIIFGTYDYEDLFCSSRSGLKKHSGYKVGGEPNGLTVCELEEGKILLSNIIEHALHTGMLSPRKKRSVFDDTSANIEEYKNLDVVGNIPVVLSPPIIAAKPYGINGIVYPVFVTNPEFLSYLENLQELGQCPELFSIAVRPDVNLSDMRIETLKNWLTEKSI